MFDSYIFKQIISSLKLYFYLIFCDFPSSFALHYEMRRRRCSGESDSTPTKKSNKKLKYSPKQIKNFQNKELSALLSQFMDSDDVESLFNNSLQQLYLSSIVSSHSSSRKIYRCIWC